MALRHSVVEYTNDKTLRTFYNTNLCEQKYLSTKLVTYLYSQTSKGVIMRNLIEWEIKSKPRERREQERHRYWRRHGRFSGHSTYKYWGLFSLLVFLAITALICVTTYRVQKYITHAVEQQLEEGVIKEQ